MTITVAIDHTAYTFTKAERYMYLNAGGGNMTGKKMKAEDLEMSAEDLFLAYGRTMAKNLK